MQEGKLMIMKVNAVRSCDAILANVTNFLMQTDQAAALRTFLRRTTGN